MSKRMFGIRVTKKQEAAFLNRYREPPNDPYDEGPLIARVEVYLKGDRWDRSLGGAAEWFEEIDPARGKELEHELVSECIEVCSRVWHEEAAKQGWL